MGVEFCVYRYDTRWANCLILSNNKKTSVAEELDKITHL